MSIEAIERAKQLHDDPVAFVQFLQRCLEYRLAGEYSNRLFMFLAATMRKSAEHHRATIRSKRCRKEDALLLAGRVSRPDNVIILSSSTAAWLKRKVLKGLDTRGKVIILIEERGDLQGQTKYQFEQIYSEDKIKIGFNVRGEGGDWEPVEVELQGPLTFITSSTELEESYHASTREWEVNPDEGPEQSRRISEWFNWRELRPIKDQEEEKKQIEVIRAYVSLLKPFNRYVIPFIKDIQFEYKTLGDRRKKPDLTTLIRTVTYLFQDLCPKDEDRGIIFAAPFTFDIVMAAAANIIAVSRGGLNRTEKRIWDFLTSHHDEILSVTRDGKPPEPDVMRDGKKIREGHPAEAFTVGDLALQSEFSDIHEKTIRESLKGLARKGWLVQTVSGRGRPECGCEFNEWESRTRRVRKRL